MKTIGVVAEYNPFHNGHEYHLAESRRKAQPQENTGLPMQEK